MSDRDKLIAEARRLTECRCSYYDGPLQECGKDGDHISQLIANLADALEGAVAELVRDTPDDTEWEYGTAYDVDSATTAYTATHSQEHARKLVAESPTDTGLIRRRKAGPWLPVDDSTKGTER